MKAINVLSIAIVSACFFSCAGNSSSKTNDSNTTDVSQTSTNASGKASFSANLDGEGISGGEIDNMQLQNTAFIYPAADNGKRLLFFLHSDKTGDKAYSFRFSVPDKTGSFTKKNHDDQPFDITLDFLGGDFFRYWSDDVTVTISSVTGTRLTGSFSGKFILSDDTFHGTKKEVTVTDGKFDVPFSTGNIRPE